MPECQDPPGSTVVASGAVGWRRSALEAFGEKLGRLAPGNNFGFGIERRVSCLGKAMGHTIVMFETKVHARLLESEAKVSNFKVRHHRVIGCEVTQEVR